MKFSKTCQNLYFWLISNHSEEKVQETANYWFNFITGVGNTDQV